MLTLDPAWLENGFFNVKADGKNSRTQQVKLALAKLQGSRLRLVKHESYGFTPGYYPS